MRLEFACHALAIITFIAVGLTYLSRAPTVEQYGPIDQSLDGPDGSSRP